MVRVLNFIANLVEESFKSGTIYRGTGWLGTGIQTVLCIQAKTRTVPYSRESLAFLYLLLFGQSK